MAGFDFEVPSTIKERHFLQSLLSLSQKRAHHFGVKFNYRWQNNYSYYVEVESSLPAMQSLLAPLIISIMSLAEGSAELKHATRRRKIALRLASEYANSLDQTTTFVTNISGMFGGIPNSLSFDPGKATHLLGNLRSLTDMLTAYYSGTLEPSGLAEESHTVLGLLMSEVLGAQAKGKSFAGQAVACTENGYWTKKLEQDVRKMKSLRRDRKHKGQGISRKSFDPLLPSIIQAAHMLCSQIKG